VEKQGLILIDVKLVRELKVCACEAVSQNFVSESRCVVYCNFGIILIIDSRSAVKVQYSCEYIDALSSSNTSSWKREN